MSTEKLLDDPAPVSSRRLPALRAAAACDPIEIHSIAARHLARDQIDAWSRLHAADLSLASPFLHPDFTSVVASVRDDVEVGILRRGDRYVGFFPFQRCRGDVGGPVGAGFCDVQGAVVAPDTILDAQSLLNGCGLTAWYFDQVPMRRSVFRSHACCKSRALYIDLSKSFADYCAGRREGGSREIARAGQKRRKLQRDTGRVRFLASTDSAEVFETLMRWKSEQYLRCREANLIAPKWVRSMLERMFERGAVRCGGMLSALWVGGRLAAAHFGLRCGEVLHAWFPGYDPELSRYSPGLILWVELAKAASELGIRRIELGPGQQRFKRNLASGSHWMGEGVATTSAWRRWSWRVCIAARQRIRVSPLRHAARTGARLSRRFRVWREVRSEQ